MESGGILDVFPTFQTAVEAEKGRCSAADDLFRGSLEEILSLGGLGIQYCIKSELAYSKLHEIPDGLIAVDYSEFNDKYNQHDVAARTKMGELVNSDANKVTKVFSTLF